jgi:hypothetical protein
MSLIMAVGSAASAASTPPIIAPIQLYRLNGVGKALNSFRPRPKGAEGILKRTSETVNYLRRNPPGASRESLLRMSGVDR